MEGKNLLQDSKAYYENNEFYERFSQAEDRKGIVEEFLKEITVGKKVLDAGCGTGKYIPVVEEVAQEYVGVDLSQNQLDVAFRKLRKDTSFLYCANLKDISLAENTFDVVYATWVLGTMVDCEERKAVLEKLNSSLRRGGCLYVIDNAEEGEFERIRGHCMKTYRYNKWLTEQGFIKVKEGSTYFSFASKAEAQAVFEGIYGKSVAAQISSATIEHKILILKRPKQ